MTNSKNEDKKHIPEKEDMFTWWNDCSENTEASSAFVKFAEDLSNSKKYASKMSRVFEHMMKDTPWAIISAHTDPRNPAKNNKEQRRLKQILINMGKGFINTKGAWVDKETSGITTNLYAVRENSIFVPNISREEALDLGREFEQQSVIVGIDSYYEIVDLSTNSPYINEHGVEESGNIHDNIEFYRTPPKLDEEKSYTIVDDKKWTFDTTSKERKDLYNNNKNKNNDFNFKQGEYEFNKNTRSWIYKTASNNWCPVVCISYYKDKQPKWADRKTIIRTYKNIKTASLNDLNDYEYIVIWFEEVC